MTTAKKNGASAPPQDVFDMTIHGRMEAQRVRIETLVDEVERLRNASLRPVQLIAPATGLAVVTLSIILAIGGMFSSGINDKIRANQDTLTSVQAELKSLQSQTVGAYTIDNVIADFKTQVTDLRDRVRELSDKLVLEAIQSRRNEQSQVIVPAPVPVPAPSSSSSSNNDNNGR